MRGIVSILLPCMLCIVDLARSCSVERASTFVLSVDLSQEFLEKDLFLQPNHTCIQATAWVFLEEIEKKE